MLSIAVNIAVAAILSAIIVGVSSPVYTVSRTLMTGLSISHAVMAGGLVGIYVQYVLNTSIPPEIVSIAFVITLALFTAELTERGYDPDTAGAISLAISTFFLVLFTYLSGPYAFRAWSIVVGTSVIITSRDLLTLAIAAVITVFVLAAFHRELMYVAFDPEGCKALGYNIRFYRYVEYATLALVVTTLTYTLGIIVSHVLIAAPGIVSINFSRRRYLEVATGIAMITTLGGYGLSYLMNTPSSLGVGIIATFFIILGEILKIYRKRAKS